MGHSLKLRLGTILVLAATLAVMLAAAASAGPPVRETIHDEETFVLDDYCDVSGLERADCARHRHPRPHQSARAGSPGVLPPARDVEREC